MKVQQNLLNQILKIRCEYAHGLRSFSPAELSKHLSEMGLSIPAGELPEFVTSLMQVLGRGAGGYYVPRSILQAFAKLLEGRTAKTVCDPWASIGSVLACVCEATHSTKALAFTKNVDEAELGRVLLNSADWQVGDPCLLLSTLAENLDVVASVLPLGMRTVKPITLQAPDGTTLTVQDDLGHLILAAASVKLSASGVGLFVVSEAFFRSQRSILRKSDTLGLGMAAALALPPGAFAPYANIPTYLVVIEKKPASRTFVGQLSTDDKTNVQIIKNFKQGQEGGSLELGRFTEVSTFTGIGFLRMSERLEQAEQEFGYPAVRLDDLATGITLGQLGNEFAFPKKDNAILVPLIGNSDVIVSFDDAPLKQQNYAQVAIDPSRSDAGFVARFLNSELGKEIRELNKSGFIPKLNKQSLKVIRVFIPDLKTQRQMLATEARIISEENVLLGLQNQLSECRRELWANPHSQADVSQRVDALSSRLSGELKRQTAESLDQWFESLPFPMASILRAWQASVSDDFKTKYEHLLHFFEASSEFVGIILLSAFSSRKQIFGEIKERLYEALKHQNLSFRRATFGTWKVVIEYLGKQVRRLLSGNKEERAMCADMFADPTTQFPEALCRKEVTAIVSKTNKMRNDWSGHGGVVGQDEANLRNQHLLSEVQNFRQAIGALWSDVQLVHCLHCRPRRGLFENEVAVLMGSNSEFLKETRFLSTWLDVERLYLVGRDGGRALQLLPLIQVGPSPSSAKNACYLFSRLEKDGLRYVSYHFIDQPERIYSIEVACEAISLLEENEEI